MTDKPEETELVPPIGAETGEVPDVEDDGVLMPDLFDLPKEWNYTRRAVVGLKCYNFTAAEIAKQLKISVWAVKEHLRDSKVKEITQKGSYIRKLVLQSMCEGLAMRCLSKISINDIDALPVKERVEVARKVAAMAKDISAKPYEEDQGEQGLLDSLKKETKKIGEGE